MARPLSSAHGYYNVGADTGQLSGSSGFSPSPSPSDVLSGAPGYFLPSSEILSGSSGFYDSISDTGSLNGSQGFTNTGLDTGVLSGSFGYFDVDKILVVAIYVESGYVDSDYVE